MRKYLIGAMASSLIASVAMVGVASADVTGLSIGASISPAKQDKKQRGGVTVFFESNDAHDGFLLPPGGPGCAPGDVTPACKFYPPSIQDAIALPPDLKFDPGKLPDCNLASIQGKDAASAKAACPGSAVGQGSTVIRTLDGTAINGTVTAFNGVPSGANPTLYLLVDLAGIATKPILQGTIAGTTLTVAIPPVAGTAIEHFDTTLNKVVSGKKKNKKTGKTTKTYYLSAKCSKGIWPVVTTVTYQNGKVLTASKNLTCKQKKKK